MRLVQCTTGRPGCFVALDTLQPDVQGDSDAFYSAITAEPFPADGITAQETQSWFWTPFYQAGFNYKGPTKQSWHGFLRAAAQHPLPFQLFL